MSEWTEKRCGLCGGSRVAVSSLSAGGSFTVSPCPACAFLDLPPLQPHAMPDRARIADLEARLARAEAERDRLIDSLIQAREGFTIGGTYLPPSYQVLITRKQCQLIMVEFATVKTLADATAAVRHAAGLDDPRPEPKPKPKQEGEDRRCEFCGAPLAEDESGLCRNCALEVEHPDDPRPEETET